MNSKLLAGIAVVVVVIIVAAAAVVMLGGDDSRDGGDDTPAQLPGLRQEIYPGDGFTMEGTVTGLSETVTVDVRVDSTDGYYMTATMTTNGQPQTMQLGFDSFMTNIQLSDDIRNQCDYVRTETITTPLGEFECDVLTLEEGGQTATIWVADNGVKYRQSVDGVYGMDMEVTVDLASCTLFGDAPEHDPSVIPSTPAKPGQVVDNMRFTLRPGDGYAIDIVVESGNSTSVYTMEYVVDSVDGDSVTYTMTAQGNRQTETGTADEFLATLAPMMSTGLLTDTTQMVDTIAGDVECCVLTVPYEGGTITMLYSVNTFVMYSATYTTSEGTMTMTLEGCSLLVAE